MAKFFTCSHCHAFWISNGCISSGDLCREPGCLGTLLENVDPKINKETDVSRFLRLNLVFVSGFSFFFGLSCGYWLNLIVIWIKLLIN